MKKLIIVGLLLSMSPALFSHEIKQPSPLTRDDYLKKMRSQKTAGLILAGTGTVLCITAATLVMVDLSHLQLFPFPTNAEQPKYHDGLINTLAVAGTVALISSIPCLMAAHRNKREAKLMAISIQPEKTFRLQNTLFVSQVIPSVSFKYKF